MFSLETVEMISWQDTFLSKYNNVKEFSAAIYQKECIVLSNDVFLKTAKCKTS